jgi:uncharacterized membrane protein
MLTPLQNFTLLCVSANLSTTVTRLGEFLTIGRLFTVGTKMTEVAHNFLALFTVEKKKQVLIMT